MVRREEIIREKLSSYRGTIISGSTEIEDALLFWLSQYFLPSGNRKSHILYFEILSELTFNKKISIYKEIFPIDDGSRLRSKKQSKVISALGRINYIRNVAAHGVLSIPRSNVNKITLYYGSDLKEVLLDDNRVKEFKEDQKYLLKTFIGRYYY